MHGILALPGYLQADRIVTSAEQESRANDGCRKK
jgi:hypothetical protein